MIPYIIGGILAAIGIVTFIIGCKKIKLNIEIEEINRKFEKDNKTLRQEHYALNRESERLSSEISFLQKQRDETERQSQKSFQNYCEVLDMAYTSEEKKYDLKLKNLQDKIEAQFEKDKQIVWDAFEKYVDTLEQYYLKVEQDFDASTEKIKIEFQSIQEDLEKIKHTYAAAIEAQLRETELIQSLDFFCLSLTTAEQSTIALIEELKPRLPEPRVLCMLVWQTFYQKKMNSLCANVLKKATPVCGIYKITNRKTGLCYIGQSVDIAKRWKDHAKCGLGIDTPSQNKLYKAMLNDGLTNFSFELLEECEKNLLNEKEKFYIDLYQACDYGYNSTSGNN